MTTSYTTRSTVTTNYTEWSEPNSVYDETRGYWYLFDVDSLNILDVNWEKIRILWNWWLIDYTTYTSRIPA